MKEKGNHEINDSWKNLWRHNTLKGDKNYLLSTLLWFIFKVKGKKRLEWKNLYICRINGIARFLCLLACMKRRCKIKIEYLGKKNFHIPQEVQEKLIFKKKEINMNFEQTFLRIQISNPFVQRRSSFVVLVDC